MLEEKYGSVVHLGTSTMDSSLEVNFKVLVDISEIQGTVLQDGGRMITLFMAMLNV